jgi:xanthine dehydrogenase YagT iron-sulfur-binding subunit
MSEHSNEKDRVQEESQSGVSRRDFLKISGISAAVPLVAGPGVVIADDKKSAVYGSGKLAMEFNINRTKYKTDLEPRVTLLDALRDHFQLTGAKRVCDRGECGACTVLMDDRAIYSCMVLAIEAQGAQITTVESLACGNELHPVQQAFVEHDASQCGFCTPGFVMACKAFLDKYPKPTTEDIRRGVSGNFCRCGTYDGIKQALAQLARKEQRHA